MNSGGVWEWYENVGTVRNNSSNNYNNNSNCIFKLIDFRRSETHSRAHMSRKTTPFWLFNFAYHANHLSTGLLNLPSLLLRKCSAKATLPQDMALMGARSAVIRSSVNTDGEVGMCCFISKSNNDSKIDLSILPSLAFESRVESGKVDMRREHAVEGQMDRKISIFAADAAVQISINYCY